MKRATVIRDAGPEWHVTITGRGPVDAVRRHVQIMLTAMADQSGLDVTAAQVDEVGVKPRMGAPRRVQ